MRQVAQALELVDLHAVVSVRPHPAASGGQISLDSTIRVDEHASVIEALSATDIAVCGALSTVAVESVCLGKQTLPISGPHVLMTSPAEGLRGLEIFLTSGNLAQALRNIKKQEPAATTQPKELFSSGPERPLLA
jgi:hypothetical protein